MEISYLTLDSFFQISIHYLWFVKRDCVSVGLEVVFVHQYIMLMISENKHEDGCHEIMKR